MRVTTRRNMAVWRKVPDTLNGTNLAKTLAYGIGRKPKRVTCNLTPDTFLCSG